MNENFSHALNVLECSVYNEQMGYNTWPVTSNAG